LFKTFIFSSTVSKPTMNLIKAGLILLVAILVLLPIAVWTYNLVILNSVFETKANINYIDIVMQHGNVFASFFLFLLPTTVNLLH
jgi:hypothetical protein